MRPRTTNTQPASTSDRTDARTSIKTQCIPMTHVRDSNELYSRYTIYPSIGDLSLGNVRSIRANLDNHAEITLSVNLYGTLLTPSQHFFCVRYCVSFIFETRNLLDALYFPASRRRSIFHASSVECPYRRYRV